jgi:ornithine cyclodeaminase/alanine dehydrogenase-like protein (mu-crystallin family)
MRVLGEEQVAALLTPADAFAAVEGSLLRIARGEVDNPARLRLALPDGQFAVMPCVDRGLGYAGLKAYAWTPRGAPFLVVLFTLDGELAAAVEASTLGERRTAAASAVAAAQLARPDASTLGVFGAGRQAASHVAALRDALPSIERVLVHGRDAARLDLFCDLHRCEPAPVEQVGACDVVVTATTADRPVLRGEWLAAGAFVCAVGANDPAARELDDAVLERAALVCVDSIDQSRLEAGDLVEPASRGVVDWADVVELPAIVAGTAPGRADDDDVVVFKSNGMAAWDLAAAARALALARG